MSSSPLPPLYDRWVTELTGGETVGEPDATCLDCPMLGDEGQFSYHPSTKCCTYTPAIPNYLVGAALADERLDDVAGRETLRARIARRAGVSPLGLDPDPLTQLLHTRAHDAFGRAPSLRCPHYHVETGKCGVWLHRNAVCSTWFCKHTRGAVGQSFWHAMRDLLNQVERDLTRWCVLELGAPYAVASPPQPGQAAASLSPEDLQHTASDADYQRAWGDWSGREQQLYTRCAELVGALSWVDVVSICGPEVGLRARALARAGQRRDTAFVPEALVLRKLEIARAGDPVVLGSYTGTDPIAVPPLLLELLPAFRGQPTRQALDEIARDADVDLDDELLIRLVDFGVLADAGDDGGS